MSLRSGLFEDRVDEIGEALGPHATVAYEPTPAPATTYWVTSQATPEELDTPGLQAVIVPWAGVPHPLMAQIAVRPDLKLYNLHHNGAATAEMAVGLLISAARGLAAADRGLRKGHWYGRMDEHRNVLLAGKRAAIVGYGAIGRRVAAALQALGMETVGIARSAGDGHVGADALDDELARSHALVLCVPLTAETDGLVDARRIRLLREPRLLVNVSRGAVVVERDLYDACRDGTLFAAGIDTWYRYPQDGDRDVAPSEFPFAELDNVVMSPHRGGDGDDTETLRTRALIALLQDVSEGVPVKPVDPRLGY
ncbi:MAG: hydroxyacid dehydrogenase [Armatimonadetes bacterium]|nr:hydroxyacid dehydrogenase [Armatimonadota bacterium]